MTNSETISCDGCIWLRGRSRCMKYGNNGMELLTRKYLGKEEHATQHIECINDQAKEVKEDD